MHAEMLLLLLMRGHDVQSMECGRTRWMYHQRCRTVQERWTGVQCVRYSSQFVGLFRLSLSLITLLYIVRKFA